MMITREMLAEALARFLALTPAPSYWRKATDGRLVRFVAWGRRAQ